MTPLARWLQRERDAESVVAWRWDSRSDTDRRVTWRDLQNDVALLRDRLETAPKGGWILLTDDAYAFAVGLFALLYSGRHAISPPNRQSGALGRLQSRARGIITDRPDWFPEGASLHPLLRETDPSVASALLDESRLGRGFAPLDPEALAVEFYTSGTTGDEKPVLKKVRHLEDETLALSALWDPIVSGATVFCSASHQHLYGLLFGVLWPIESGHAFQAQHFLHAGELVPRLRDAERAVLASVPTHLKRLALHADAAQLRGHCRVIFSSGGPLPQETAHRVESLVGDAPLEVLGSTETGGIGWRRQASGDPNPLWTAIADVELREDPELGTLRVRSPFVSEGGADGFTTGDRFVLHEGGRFELLGRADRVVKIGERRLDLVRMELQLRGHACLDEIALTTLQRDIGETRVDRAEAQERVAAVVVPSEEGWRLIQREGKRAFASELRSELSEEWDPVLHPRYWRLVLELPEDRQGKVTRDRLRKLFQPGEWGRQTQDRPEILAESRSEAAIERVAIVPADLSCFPGHFPGRAVVPGVLQLDWGLSLLEVWLGEAPPVEEIQSLKLLKPLEPGDRFRVRVERPAPDRIEIKLWFEEDVFAKARVRIANPCE